MIHSSTHALTNLLFSWLILTGNPVHAPRLQNQPRPNILVIMADDLGYGDLGSFGAKDIHTPHLDSLLKAGMRLDNFHSNSPVCSPTRAALLTGCYPDRVGVPGVIRTDTNDSWGYLKEDILLLPDVLKQRGYTTALIGKWHLGLRSPNLPNERGFDFFHGFLEGMMDDSYTHIRDGQNFLRLNQQVINPEGHPTDLFTQWSVNYLRKQVALKQPFFLYLAHTAPHVPVQPPDKWLRRVQQRHPELPEKRAKLAAVIEQMDDGIGQVIRTLKETGTYDNTLIIFCSDNGGQLDVGASNGHVRSGKGSMYEGGIKVPAFAVWPGRIQPGSRSGQLLVTMDIFPTLLEAAGAKPVSASDGRSFLPALLGKSAPQTERTLFFTRREGGVRYGGKTIDAVRQGDWKLLQNYPDAPYELYNLREDSLEQRNLIEQHPDVRQKLSFLLQQHINQSGKTPWQQPD